MKEIAEEKVPRIDLYASSKTLMEKLGPKASAEMVNQKGNATHFNGTGARAMADLVMKELTTAQPQLREHLKTL
jgi:hypothetical protein